LGVVCGGGGGGAKSSETWYFSITQKQNSNVPSAMSHFASPEDIQNIMTMVLKELLENNFQQYFRVWQKYLKVCMKSKGDHTS
jgi:hypothetical protein